MSTTISRQISIKPIDLDENIKNTIIEKLKDNIEKDDCYYENGYIWMNIPAQVLIRDIETGQYSFNNITFTTNQLFGNL